MHTFLVTLCPKHLSQKLSRICTLHLRCSLCRWHLHDIVFNSVRSLALCALLCKVFSLSLHILDESVISRNRAINSFLKSYKTSSTICFQIAEDVLSFLNFLYIILCFYTEKRLKKGLLFYFCNPLAIKKLRNSVSKGA